MQDNRDLFGFDRHRRNHSGSSSLGPSAIRDELQYLTVMTRQRAALDSCLRNSSAIRDELQYLTVMTRQGAALDSCLRNSSAIRDELQYLTVMTRQGAALDRCLRNSSAIRDELKYIHDDDDVIVKVLYVARCH